MEQLAVAANPRRPRRSRPCDTAQAFRALPESAAGFAAQRALLPVGLGFPDRSKALPRSQAAFWLMVQLMYGFNLRAIYREGLPLLQDSLQQLRELLQKQMPKLARHLESSGADVAPRAENGAHPL